MIDARPFCKTAFLLITLPWVNKIIVGIVSKETAAASVGNWNTINWDNQTTD